MKIKANILDGISKYINKTSHLKFVTIVLGVTMLLMYIGWELGVAYARM
ncbi:hypothetical protein [Aquimarina sediminis]|nr:hypothetical protein [Aquimarina sediminis]